MSQAHPTNNNNKLFKQLKPFLPFAILLILATLYIFNFLSSEFKDTALRKNAEAARTKDVSDYWKLDPVTHKYVSK